MAPNELLFMTDYHADPVWSADAGCMVSLDLLPVTEPTKASIREWAGRWERLAWQDMHFNDVQNGMSGGPAEPVPAGAFEEIDRESRRLCQQLRDELGVQWRVGYVSFPDNERRVEWENAAEP